MTPPIEEAATLGDCDLHLCEKWTPLSRGAVAMSLIA